MISTLSSPPNDLYFEDMRNAFPSADEIERNFLKIRDKSPAARLLCPESIRRLHYSDEDGAYASIALMAYDDQLLPRLDTLIKKFKIETHATPRFRENRLKEKWLKKVPNGKLKSIQKAGANTISALSELVVADYISTQKDCSITTIEAWNESSPDIQYKKQNDVTNVEVKYFGPTPEFEALISEQIKTKCSRVIYFNERRCADYIFGRIAQAVLQLKKHPPHNSEIWLVFHPLSQRSIFERCYLKNGKQWSDKKFVSEFFSKKIGSKNPCEWLQEVDCLVLATLKDWHLNNVKRYRF